MSERTVRRILTFLAVALFSAALVFAQSPTAVEIPIHGAGNTWQDAQSISSSQPKLYVVTVDEPDRKQSCRVQSFTQDELICGRAIGGPRTFRPSQVAALILPGDAGLKVRLVLGFNAGLGAAIWGTVVLAAVCPVCAVATGIAALLLFGAAGATLIGDDQPDRLLYLAPGQELSRKLGFVQG